MSVDLLPLYVVFFLSIRPSHPPFLDFSIIKDCHDDSDRTWELQVAASQLTPADHEYTPWIVIDGVLYDNSSHNLQKAVCDAYTIKGGESDTCSTSKVALN